MTNKREDHMISSDSFFLNNGVDTVFLTRVKEGDSCEGKMADLEETKRRTVLESADGACPMGQKNMLRRC